VFRAKKKLTNFQLQSLKSTFRLTLASVAYLRRNNCERKEKGKFELAVDEQVEII